MARHRVVQNETKKRQNTGSFQNLTVFNHCLNYNGEVGEFSLQIESGMEKRP